MGRQKALAVEEGEPEGSGRFTLVGGKPVWGYGALVMDDTPSGHSHTSVFPSLKLSFLVFTMNSTLPE